MTNKPEKSLEEIKAEFQMFVPEDDGSAMDWLENQLQAERQRCDEMVEELIKWQTYQDEVESIFDWLQGENGEFPDLSQKPHYSFRSQLRKLRATLTQPTPLTNKE